jgi:Short C-terminal domain
VIRFLERAKVRGMAFGLMGAFLFTASAQAGIWDSLFGTGGKEAKPVSTVSSAASKRRSWRIGEFTEVRLVSSEPGSEPNAHPGTLSPEALRQMLSTVRTTAAGADQALFAASELDELLESLHEALLTAGPKDDVLLLSSSRRGGGILVPPTAVTARLFIQGEHLNMVVNDSRLEFYYKYRGTGRPPEFTFGSRALASSQAALQRPGAVSRRADWLEIPLKADAAVVATAATQQGVAPTAGVAAAPPPPVAAQAQPAVPAMTPESADEVERRLATLKRLRDKGLITEDEYQEKRKSVMQRL